MDAEHRLQVVAPRPSTCSFTLLAQPLKSPPHRNICALVPPNQCLSSKPLGVAAMTVLAILAATGRHSAQSCSRSRSPAAPPARLHPQPRHRLLQMLRPAPLTKSAKLHHMNRPNRTAAQLNSVAIHHKPWPRKEHLSSATTCCPNNRWTNWSQPFPLAALSKGAVPLACLESGARSTGSTFSTKLV